jgi:hypothetical protein|tara:strand:+ start:1474 stop:2373 length:900 start_codon:yes stop_codon:yes gene_type:complete
MATDTTTQINRPAPFLETAGMAATEAIGTLAGKSINTGAFAPQVVGQNALSQQAQQSAASQAGLGTLAFDATTGAVTGVGAGSGIAGYQPFLDSAAGLTGTGAGTGTGSISSYQSPYTTAVYDAMETQMASQKAQQDNAMAAQALQSGAFGGGRFGAQEAVANTEYNQSLAEMQANLNMQGYQQAQGARQQDFMNEQGLAQLQPQLAQQNQSMLQGVGTQDLQYRQAIQDADAAGAKEAAYEPYQRYGFLGEQLTGLMGGYPGGTRMTTAPAASPLQTYGQLGLAGLAGVSGAKKAGLF